MNYLIPLCIFLLTIERSDAQDLPFRPATHEWNADSLGNVRAIVSVDREGPVASVIIPWRRSDAHPENKRIIIEAAASAAQVTNFTTGRIDNEKGEISFEPVLGKGIYYIYYMPYKNEGRSNYPKGVYLSPVSTASAAWLKMASAAPNLSGGGPATASVREIQSIDAFNSSYPMEVIATAGETAAVIKKSGRKDYLVFPEDRR